GQDLQGEDPPDAAPVEGQELLLRTRPELVVERGHGGLPGVRQTFSIVASNSKPRSSRPGMGRLLKEVRRRSATVRELRSGPEVPGDPADLLAVPELAQGDAVACRQRVGRLG